MDSYKNWKIKKFSRERVERKLMIKNLPYDYQRTSFLMTLGAYFIPIEDKILSSILSRYLEDISHSDLHFMFVMVYEIKERQGEKYKPWRFPSRN